MNIWEFFSKSNKKNRNKQNKDTATYIYFILQQSARINHIPVKIGLSNNPKRRLKALQTGNPRKLTLRGTVKTSSRRDAFALERQLHSKYKDKSINGEWFLLPRGEVEACLNELVEQHNNKQIQVPSYSSYVFHGLKQIGWIPYVLGRTILGLVY